MFFSRGALQMAAYPELPATAVWPEDQFYDTARLDDNARLDFRPAVIVYCYSARDVAKCVAWATKYDRAVAIRSGGHDYEGFSLNDGGIVIDLSRYRGVFPAEDGNTAWIRAGTDLHTLYHDLAAIGRTLPGGTCPTVAVAGLATGGGYGMLVRRHGLLCDRLMRVRLVDATGALRDSAEDRNGENMLWAARGGGGGNFGVVTDLQFRLVDAPESVATFSIKWTWSADLFSAVMERWMKTIERSRDLTSVLTLTVGGDAGIHVFGQFLGEQRFLDEWLAELAADTQPTFRDVRRVPYIDAVDAFGGPAGARQSWKMKSSFGNAPLSAEGIGAINAVVARGQPANVTMVLEFDSLGGALGDRAASATAFPHRDARYSLQYQAYWTDPEVRASATDAIRRAFDQIDPFTARTSYRNYCDLELTNWQRRYYGSNYPRLQRIKAELDPDEVFAFPQSIEPLHDRG